MPLNFDDSFTTSSSPSANALKLAVQHMRRFIAEQPFSQSYLYDERWASICAHYGLPTGTKMPAELRNAIKTSVKPEKSPYIDHQRARHIIAKALPDGYPTSRCACAQCVREFVEGDEITPHTNAMMQLIQHAENNYQLHLNTPAGQWNHSQIAKGFSEIRENAQHEHRVRHRERTQRRAQMQLVPEYSRFKAKQRETLLSDAQRSAMSPLRYLLKKNGRVWSAEVEVNGITRDMCAERLGMQTGQYSTKPDQPTVMASSDGTVDAEIKISCMRDGSQQHQNMAIAAYLGLADQGAWCAHNAGHHVHVDATRVSDLGVERAKEISVACAKLGWVTSDALARICASGYKGHRYGGPDKVSQFWNTSTAWSGRGNFHGSPLLNSVASGTGRRATLEFRLPNATIEPLRSHAYVALALGVLDWAERAVLDGDSDAQDQLATITDRLAHASPWDEETGALFLRDNLQISDESLVALAVAAHTSPASAKHKRAWLDRVSLPKSVLA